MNWDAICFDLDNTLFSHELAFEKAVCHCMDLLFVGEKIHRLSSNIVFPVFKTYCDQFWIEYEKGYLSEKEYQRKRFLATMKEFNLYFPPSIADEFQRHYYDIVAKYCELFPSVPELLTELQRQAIVLAIITNGTTTTQMKKIRKMELTKWFQSKYIFISDECSSAKPEKRIFEVVKKEIGKNRLLYIGDSWEQDVVGAIEAGWDAIYFNTRLKTPSTSHTPLTSCISMKQLHDFLNQNL